MENEINIENFEMENENFPQSGVPEIPEIQTPEDNGLPDVNIDPIPDPNEDPEPTPDPSLEPEPTNTNDPLAVPDDDLDDLRHRADGLERDGKKIPFCGGKICATRHGCTGATNCDYSYGAPIGR